MGLAVADSHLGRRLYAKRREGSATQVGRERGARRATLIQAAHGHLSRN